MKITLLGAGSGFTQPLFTDIFNINDLPERGTIGLVDTDTRRLAVNVRLMNRLMSITGKEKWKVEASSDRRKILKGSDYIVNTIEVAGLANVEYDYRIPMKYGIDQCIGDTIGPGGIMKALRTMPTMLKIMDDVQDLCPRALIMNYTNPMSILTLGCLRHSDLAFVGLCHSVQSTSRMLAETAGIPYEEMEFRCAGNNHLAWFTSLKHKGKDLYPVLLEASKHDEIYKQNPVRWDIMQQLGYFVTESSGHFSEYVPWYRKKKNLLKKYTGKGFLGESGFYLKAWPKSRKKTDENRKKAADGKLKIENRRSHEYAADIIEAHYTGRPAVIWANVINNGAISNLPSDGCVEVPVTVDRHGFTTGMHAEPLPLSVVPVNRAHMSVYDLCASGILEKDREMIIHAMIHDPLSSAVCSPAQIRSMAEELFKAQRRDIPSWCLKIKAPKKVKWIPPSERSIKTAAKKAASSMDKMNSGKL